MTTVSAGATASETLTGTSTVTIMPAANGTAFATVTRGGHLVYSHELRHAETVGPYLTDDVLTITAARGAVDYTVDAYDAAANPLSLENPGAGTFALQSIDGALTWTAVV